MRYKEVLKKYGISQTELADRLGINRVSVSRLLSEKNDMRASTIEKIAKAIGCTSGELFDDAADINTPSPSLVCPKCGARLKLVEDEPSELEKVRNANKYK